MRRTWIGLWIASALLVGCKGELEGTELVAAKADRTTRQLIAGLNAGNRTVLAKLVVLTSTVGGEPRHLRPEEADRLVFPKPPFTYAGSGKPGYMLLRDGAGTKHRVHLVTVGDDLEVVGRREQLNTGAGNISVVSILEPVPD